MCQQPQPHGGDRRGGGPGQFRVTLRDRLAQQTHAGTRAQHRQELGIAVGAHGDVRRRNEAVEVGARFRLTGFGLPHHPIGATRVVIDRSQVVVSAIDIKRDPGQFPSHPLLRRRVGNAQGDIGLQSPEVETLRGGQHL